MVNKRLAILTSCLVAVAALSACHDDNSSAPTTSGTTENFSTFAIATFKLGANTAPVNYDDITLVQDVNDSPTAFDALLM